MSLQKIQVFFASNTYFFRIATCFFLGISAGINISLPTNCVITIFSIGVLFSLTHECNKVTTQSSLIFFWSIGFIAAATFWITIAIYDPLLTPLTTACLVAASLYFVHALIYALTYAIVNRLLFWIFFNSNKKNDALLLIISFSLSFGVAEVIRSQGFWAMPWGLIGYTQTMNPLLSGIYPIVGSYGVTTMTVLFSALLAVTFKTISDLRLRGAISSCIIYFKNKAPHIAIVSAIFIACFLSKYIEWTRKDIAKLQIRVVHTHIPNIQKYDAKVQQYSLQKIIDLSSLQDVNLTIYPELYLVNPAQGIDKQTRRQIVDSVIASKNSQLFGAPDSEVTKNGDVLGSLNIMLQLDEHGNTKRYAKEILLPFSEYMPTNPLLIWAMPYIFKFPLANFNSGSFSNTTLLQVKDVNLAISICNEIAYPNNIHKHAANAQVLINSASDSWIPNQIYALHSWQISKVRAMEAQKPMLRSNNTGYSGHIDAWGKESVMAYEVEATQKYEVTPRLGNTPYTNLISFLSKI